MRSPRARPAIEGVRLAFAATYPWIAAILTSLFIAARERGDDHLDALRSIAGPSPLAAAGLA
jgi:hypothetical protein